MSFDLLTFFFQTANFLVLVFVLWRLMWKPLRTHMENRRMRIAEDLRVPASNLVRNLTLVLPLVVGLVLAGRLENPFAGLHDVAERPDRCAGRRIAVLVDHPTGDHAASGHLDDHPLELLTFGHLNGRSRPLFTERSLRNPPRDWLQRPAD